MKKTRKDKQLEEFENNDLGESLKLSHSAVTIRKKSRLTSILLNESLVTKLKTKAQRKGIGYQTLLKIIVMEHVDQY